MGTHVKNAGPQWYLCFQSDNNLVRVLWDHSLHGSRLIYIGCEDWVITRVSGSLSSLPFHLCWYNFLWLHQYESVIIFYTFSLLSFVSHHLFSCWLFHIYLFLTLIHVFDLLASPYPLHIALTTWQFLFYLIFHHWHFHCLLSSLLAHKIILHIASYTRGYWVWSLGTWI